MVSHYSNDVAWEFVMYKAKMGKRNYKFNLKKASNFSQMGTNNNE